MNRGASAPLFHHHQMTPPVTSHQHISVRGDKQTVTEDFKPVTR